MTHMTVTGNLASDPVLQHSVEGQPWAGLTVLWSEREKNHSTGQWQDTPVIAVKVSCFGTLAANVAHSLKKGTRVTVTGKVRPTSWQSPNGEQLQIKMAADSVAPDLRWAVAGVQKATANQQGNQQQGGFNQQNSQAGFGQQQADPFADQPANQQGGNDDEPPF